MTSSTHPLLRLKTLMRMSVAFSLVVLIFLNTASVTTAQKELPKGVWTSQHRIPDFGDESQTPFLIADKAGQVYAFNTQPVNGSLEAIFIRTWSLERGWSPPADIILSPLPGFPVIEGVFLDGAGNIHMTFFAGNEVYGAIYYTWAPASLADQPQYWSNPLVIGENAVYLGSALTGDVANYLYMVYGGKQDGIGLYMVVSSDGGRSWSKPKLITLMQDNDLLPNATNMVVDWEGNLHMVWSETDPSGTDLVIFYDRFDSQEMKWSQPFALARKDVGDYKSAWPTIVVYQKSLMVIYQDSNPGTRWMRRSLDGGITWTDPVRPWTFVGEYKQANLVVDSSDTLHIITGNRSGDCCHGMWHAVWNGDHWSPLEPIVMGPRTPQFDPSAPQSIISQGNVILVTWWTDSGGAPRNGIWYSYTILDTPRLPIEDLPKPQVTKAAVPTPMFSETQPLLLPTIAPSETPTIPSLTDFKSKPFSNNPGLPVVVGLVLAVLIAACIMIIRLINSNHT